MFRYEKAVIAMAKQSVTLEVLSYHASASLEDAQKLRVGSAKYLLKQKLFIIIHRIKFNKAIFLISLFLNTVEPLLA